jgi:hypothetical protein
MSLPPPEPLYQLALGLGLEAHRVYRWTANAHCSGSLQARHGVK